MSALRIPPRSNTSAKADIWMPAYSGTEGALLLAIAVPFFDVSLPATGARWLTLVWVIGLGTTGPLARTVEQVGQSRDLHIVDNGDGTLTITGFFVGTQRVLGDDGELLLVDHGLSKDTFVVDHNGTIDPEDDEFVDLISHVIAGPHAPQAFQLAGHSTCIAGRGPTGVHFALERDQGMSRFDSLIDSCSPAPSPE